MNIRRVRQAKKLTQEAVAHASDIDVRYLGGIERGQENPTIGVLGRIADALDVPLVRLLDRE
ncbi:MAG TPA: helix-turn-helix transcriptional regulator [Caulobacteraceae bacterium]